MKSRPNVIAERLLLAAVAAALLAGLYWSSRYSYLLFHSVVELFSILVAFGIFIVAWNSRRFWENSYFLLLGVAYLFVGAADLLHTLVYKGMGVFPGHGTNTATQLWITARSLESLSLLIAPLVLGRRLRTAVVMAAYAAVLAGALLLIFLLEAFPTCFVEGQGLTAFKVASEYAICAVLAAAAILLFMKKARFDKGVLRMMVAAIVLTTFSELSFTLYADPYAPANMIGHLLKLLSFYLIYKAVIETALAKPYSLLFRDIKTAEESVRKARDELEERVKQRTAELSDMVETLASEVRERQLAEERVENERKRLFSVLRSLPGYVVLWRSDHSILFANERFVEIFGEPAGRPCYRMIANRAEPCENCNAARVLETGGNLQWERQVAGGRTFRIWGYPFTDVDGTQLVLQLGVEVTEQKRLEAEVLGSAESERRRIGQDLHDGLGQMLGGISCLSQVLSRKLSGRSAEEAAVAAKIESAMVDALNLTRALARGLNPLDENPRSLMLALKELSGNVRNMFAVDCLFECEEPVLVEDNNVAMHIYRIAQEATNNAVRHGKAKQITIRLTSTDGAIRLAVEDDGVGLPEEIPADKGMGLRIMKYRADMMNAALRIAGNDRGGTTVSCSIPMEKRK